MRFEFELADPGHLDSILAAVQAGRLRLRGLTRFAGKDARTERPGAWRPLFLPGTHRRRCSSGGIRPVDHLGMERGDLTGE